MVRSFAAALWSNDKVVWESDQKCINRHDLSLGEADAE